jgi:hypothetical protein
MVFDSQFLQYHARCLMQANVNALVDAVQAAVVGEQHGGRVKCADGDKGGGKEERRNMPGPCGKKIFTEYRCGVVLCVVLV